MNLDEGMEFAQALVEAHYPGRWQQLTMGEHRAVAVVGSATVAVLTPKAGVQPEPFLSVICGLATEFWLDEKAYELVNALNRESVFGSHHIEPGDGRRASVLARLLVPLEPVDWNHPASTQWVGRMVHTLLMTAERTSPTLVAQLGARHFAPGAAQALWMMT
ncbi:hypothetical protein Ais01nite_58070 [Asanoa ishikariensis]|uniref:Uncharacterized protein n=1 Tax=Asanoa ishikariensis TaxID=137265 RepID=A0A1H3U074_9ACTN|nr:hypothetical protein [Asanoa ishikariensis]GIF67772.1 hypothetical protein Ais01nite_58070 [Asanoa ishikariensis]SDZ55742.1 hypothetical protein SAMN05421684_6669 [Asanoa ishikariensis]